MLRFLNFICICKIRLESLHSWELAGKLKITNLFIQPCSCRYNKQQVTWIVCMEHTLGGMVSISFSASGLVFFFRSIWRNYLDFLVKIWEFSFVQNKDTYWTRLLMANLPASSRTEMVLKLWRHEIQIFRAYFIKIWKQQEKISYFFRP